MAQSKLRMPTPEEEMATLQKQLREAQAYDRGQGDSAKMSELQRKIMALNARGAGVAGQDTGKPGIPSNSAEATEMSINALKDRMGAMGTAGEGENFLEAVTKGSELPMSDKSVQAMLSQFGKEAGAAEEGRMEALRSSLGATGGSIYDPSFMAAQNQAMSNRQNAVLDRSGQLASQQGMTNFNARSQAAQGLNQANLARNAQINALSSQLSSQLARWQDFNETPGNTTVYPTMQTNPANQQRQATGQQGIPTGPVQQLATTSRGGAPNPTPLAGASQGFGPIVNPKASNPADQAAADFMRQAATPANANMQTNQQSQYPTQWAPYIRPATQVKQTVGTPQMQAAGNPMQYDPYGKQITGGIIRTYPQGA